ncbi:uncharacterized protein SOCE836_081830 [Sorangium cellulosum]|uniref:Uncharacterized protein n=1 Tax=Sorangium cellulosum TaxID=56 RepID=A0A4P2QZE4_SORCE|nr:uncharacterized protein SOCE836_081830 [Sorangium cellulosum]
MRGAARSGREAPREICFVELNDIPDAASSTPPSLPPGMMAARSSSAASISGWGWIERWTSAPRRASWSRSRWSCARAPRSRPPLGQRDLRYCYR